MDPCFNATYYATILFTPWLMAAIGRKSLLLFGLIGLGAVSLLLYGTAALDAVLLLRAIQGVFRGCVFVPAAILLFSSLPIGLLALAIPADACGDHRPDRFDVRDRRHADVDRSPCSTACKRPRRYVTAANAGVSESLQHAGSVRTLSSLLPQQSQTLSLSDVMICSRRS
ncbi:MAG: hypothetical protein ACXVAS_16945 [Vulcanimicrobiaceae bacterium]